MEIHSHFSIFALIFQILFQSSYSQDPPGFFGPPPPGPMMMGPMMMGPPPPGAGGYNPPKFPGYASYSYPASGNFTYANSTTYYNNNNAKSWSSKDFSNKMYSMDKDGNGTESGSSAQEKSFSSSGTAKDMSEQFGVHQMWNESSQFEEKTSSSDGSENATDTKHEFHEGTNLDMAKVMANPGSAGAGDGGSKSSKDKKEEKEESEDEAYKPHSSRKRRRRRSKLFTDLVTKKKDKKHKDSDEEGPSEEQPSEFTFKNDEGVKSGFGGTCTKDDWNKCQSAKCAKGKKKERIYCMKSGDNIFGCDVTCMREACNSDGKELDEKHIGKPESKISSESKCDKKKKGGKNIGLA